MALRIFCADLHVLQLPAYKLSRSGKHLWTDDTSDTGNQYVIQPVRIFIIFLRFHRMSVYDRKSFCMVFRQASGANPVVQ